MSYECSEDGLVDDMCGAKALMQGQHVAFLNVADGSGFPAIQIFIDHPLLLLPSLAVEFGVTFHIHGEEFRKGHGGADVA
jgi:hypothetical protein